MTDDIIKRLLDWECSLANEKSELVKEACDEIEYLRLSVKVANTDLLECRFALAEALGKLADERKRGAR